MGKFSKEDAIKHIQGLSDSDVFVFTEKEQSEFLENYKKTSMDVFEKTRITELYDGIDKDFEKATGIKLPPDQTTYKFWPEQMKILKEQSGRFESEVAELKTKGGSPELQKEIEALRKASLEKDNEWKSKFEKVNRELIEKDIKSNIEMASKGFKFTILPKTVIDTFIESAKNKLSQSAKFIEGQMIFTDSDGNPRLNKETFKPYTAEELMALELDPIIDKEKKNEGGGTKPPKLQKDKDGKSDINLIVPTTVSNRVELTDYLIKSGLPLNTEEHRVAYEKYSANLPIA
jgi:hypothetical protein